MKYFSPDGIIGEIVAAGRYPTKSPSTLSRICNVTLQVRDIEKALAFYRKVFELEETKESCENIRILTDGRTELTLAAMPHGANPAIHSWTLEVKDPKAVAEQVTQFGGALLSDSAKGTVKFRAPDGNTVELAKAVA
jgi:predicted enzyme related to lactoylglutathione lyase